MFCTVKCAYSHCHYWASGPSQVEFTFANEHSEKGLVQSVVPERDKTERCHFPDVARCVGSIRKIIWGAVDGVMIC